MAILGLLSLAIAAAGVLGWLGLIRRAPAAAIPIAATPDLRGAALDTLRPVALMSAQKGSR